VPYTKHSKRGKLNIGADLAFMIAELVDEYCAEKPFCYQTIADVRAALVGVLGEFDRRFAWPYEDRKLAENGEVFVVLRERVGRE